MYLEELTGKTREEMYELLKKKTEKLDETSDYYAKEPKSEVELS